MLFKRVSILRSIGRPIVSTYRPVGDLIRERLADQARRTGIRAVWWNAGAIRARSVAIDNRPLIRSIV